MHFVAAIVTGLVLTALTASTAAAIIADEASDICPVSSNPCVITQTVDVLSGSTLDFGTRRVEIRGSGVLNVGAGATLLRSGSLLVDVSGIGIKLSEGTDGGVLFVDTFKVCSGNSAIRCQKDSTCVSASAGACTQGDGSITLRGRINGNTESPGICSLTAAGDIRLQQRILMNGTTLESDGGEIELESFGSIFIEDKMELTSGGDSTGGDFFAQAAVDIVVNGIIDAGGGDFDGGTIELDAGRDVLITEDLNADSNSGEGFGGSIDVAAGGNIEVVGGASGNLLFLTTEGHTGFDGAEAYAGDGGPQDYVAGGMLRFGPFVQLRLNGAGPDGFAEFLSIDADGPIIIEGGIEAKAKGGQGAGGDLQISSSTSVEITSTATIDVTGGESGAGSVLFYSKGDIVFDGTIDSSASFGGSGGFVVFDADVQFSSRGDVVGASNAGSDGSLVAIDGCRIQLNSGFEIRNPGSGGRATFRVAENLVMTSGATVSSGLSNRIEYRDAGITPVLSGQISPAPVVLVNPLLPSCPLCGNGLVDLGETCDDGNQTSGDGCNDACIDEGCIAQTPGYPSVSLCDDGNNCSVDSCDPAGGGCQHIASCDDGFVCTIDTCVGDLCIHTPTDALCNDNNVCTDQFCSATAGCVFSTASLPCDDEEWCNGTDNCIAGGCALHSGDPCEGLAECLNVCDEAIDSCTAPFGFPCSSDSNQCTDDVCNGIGGCVHNTNSAPCDDGIFCNGPDACVGGTCALSGGNPCSPNDPCANTCDEAAGMCTGPAGVACADDGNECTDDFCDGSGSCAHSPNSAPCDDGDLCTATDGCTAGVCVATDGGSFSSIRVVAQKRGGADNDGFVMRATIAGATIADGPADSGVVFEVRDAAGTLLYASFMPPEEFVDAGLKGTTFKFRDSRGQVPVANGMASVTIKRNTKRDEVRAKLKMRGVEIPEIVAASTLSPALLIGGSPVDGRCGSVSALACTKKGTSKLSCSD